MKYMRSFPIVGYYVACSGKYFTDVSGQLIGLIFKGQESEKKRLDSCPLQMGLIGCPETGQPISPI